MADWVDLIAKSDLEPEDVTPVEHGGRRLAVYDAPDGVYVTLATCTHGGADLTDGYFDGHLIECPLHQGCFDIRDGKPLGAPVTRPLKTFEARVVDGRVQVRL
ncbi:MAG: non-heme iron oxygenase ferredoxin subunit [Rhodobiaceae bacterium]|nr:non-heme iron oxygenase ferredoxin subunit [Rhodobiaceae bacterium]